MKWLTKKQTTATEAESKRGGLVIKTGRTFIRTCKTLVRIVVISVIFCVITLAAIGGYFLLGADRYTLAYVVVPGEVVTVVKVTPDYVFTSWLGRSHPDPRILVRKDNGWERNFPARNGDASLEPGDRLVMTKSGGFVLVEKPLSRLVAISQSADIVPIEAVPDEDAGSLIPVATPDPTTSLIKKSAVIKIDYRRR